MTANTVWIPPSATAFACLCEACLDHTREQGLLFSDAIQQATVRGSLATDSDVGYVRCPAGHELVVRRVERPPSLAHRDERQLQIS
jgi:hypothetical protein